MAVLAVGLVLVALPVVSLYAPTSFHSKSTRQTVTILNFNTEFQHNDEYALFERLMEERQPDIIALVEINQKWLDALSSKLKQYPHKRIALYGPGMALYTKFPISESEVRFFGRSHHPRILATVRLDGRPLHLEVIHPHTPSGQGWNERNEELRLVETELRGNDEPEILLGDFNCGPWAPVFRSLIDHGLHDTEQGFGPQPSWPARAGRVIPHVPIPPLIPIDHVLVSDQIYVQQRVVGPAMNSDHLPVFVKFTF